MNGDVYWFACLNAKENDPQYEHYQPEDLAKRFSHFSPIVEQMIRETYTDYFLHHDIYDIKPLHSFIYQRICLLGDAAHTTTPNMGQGAGQSIEDAYILMKALKKTTTILEALEKYNHHRVRKTRKVIQRSRWIGWVAQWENRFLVASRDIVFPWIPKSILFRQLAFLFK